MTDFGLAGTRVLVTGASRGIGYAVARAFAQAGSLVSVLSSGRAIMDAAEALSEGAGRKVTGYQCDISKRGEVRKTLKQVGPLDVLVNNAGLERITPIHDSSPDTERTFRRIIDINVIGTYLVTREALTSMSANGRIIVTSSVWGKSAVGEFSAYVASKHANIGFVRSLARELGPRGINVNAVCPGWVKTEASMLSLRRMAEREKRPEAELLDEILSSQCLGDLMDPQDVAGTYLFLASPLARNITGQSILVDRGEFLS